MQPRCASSKLELTEHCIPVCGLRRYGSYSYDPETGGYKETPPPPIDASAPPMHLLRCWQQLRAPLLLEQIEPFIIKDEAGIVIEVRPGQRGELSRCGGFAESPDPPIADLLLFLLLHVSTCSDPT